MNTCDSIVVKTLNRGPRENADPSCGYRSSLVALCLVASRSKDIAGVFGYSFVSTERAAVVPAVLLENDSAGAGRRCMTNLNSGVFGLISVHGSTPGYQRLSKTIDIRCRAGVSILKSSGHVDVQPNVLHVLYWQQQLAYKGDLGGSFRV